MLSADDSMERKIPVILFMLLFALSRPAFCQTGILDSAFTLREGMVKTGNALNLISRKTGHFFTYDSKLIDAEKKVRLDFSQAKLGIILDSIFRNDSIRYSVINRYIIVYKISPPKSEPESVPEWNLKTISGIITDFESGEALPFATIVIISSGRGTVTNNNGEFQLNITRDLSDDSLSVSYLGYYNRTIPVRQVLGNNFNIKMMRLYIPIPEIIIRNRMPQEILRKAYNSVGENYGNTPAAMTAFYREAVLKKSNLQIYSEAVLQIYKSAYTGSLHSDQMKILKSRKVENLGLKDTLTLRLKAGLSSCLLLDGARNNFDFLTPENFSQYDYRMTDIVTVDDESAYVIEFAQKPSVDIPLFKGSIYINTDNYAIMMAEFEINPLYIQKSREELVNNTAKGYNMWPVSVRYYVKYRKLENRYFLSHVRGELKFNARQKKKLFNSSFDVFFELAVTDIRLSNVARFERDEIAPGYSIFSRTIDSYDREFWGSQDFLKPEDNLLQELRNMKVKLEEFSK
jgi:hypothetical protein